MLLVYGCLKKVTDIFTVIGRKGKDSLGCVQHKVTLIILT